MTSVSNKFSNRILSVNSAVIPEILGEPALVAVSMIGSEGVDSLFDYQVILKTADSLNHLISETTNFNTAAWLGEEMSVKIQLEGNGKFVAGQLGMSGMGNVGAGVREINGIIDDAKLLRVEGRYAFYEVKLKPWLFAATLVTDCKIYQDKNVKEIIDEALSGFGYAIEWRLIDSSYSRHWSVYRRGFLRRLAVLGCAAVLLACSESSYSSSTSAMPRDHIPPLFHPHRTEFTCTYRDQHVPSIDPQAERWLQEALALQYDREIPRKQRDWKRIVELMQAAAERQHWKAMLNLVNLRLDGYGAAYGLPRDSEAAVKEVEAAMLLGIPDAYDMMGNFYQRGIGVSADASKAYAFYQRAAEMGSPEAQTFLAQKMMMKEERPDSPGRYANKPIGYKMLECAFAQGYGPAANELGARYAGERTPDFNVKALRVFHEGVKMGDAKCAGYLWREFDRPNLSDTINPGGIDTARAERYRVLQAALEWYSPLLKLPNLDAVLPLPPAKLPKWNGDRDVLLDAAKAVRMAPATLVPPSSEAGVREHTGLPH